MDHNGELKFYREWSVMWFMISVADMLVTGTVNIAYHVQFASVLSHHLIKV